MLRRKAVGNLLAASVTLLAGCKNTSNASKPTMLNSGNGISITGESHHPQFDLNYWRALLAHKNESFSGTCDMQLPSSFLSNEALRDRVRASGVDLGPPKPVDLFFWSSQPALKPWLTKYGGVPYRSKNKPWPTKSGVSATFVAQLCFRDSHDIFDGNLPGDLLTIFSIDSFIAANDESDPDYPVIVEWETIDQVENPLSSEDTCPNGFSVPQLSGVRFRTYDYAYSSRDEEKLKQTLAPIAGATWTSIISLPGTKIGRTYYPVQPGWDPRDWASDEFGHNQWELVATLYSVSLTPRLEWVVLDSPHFGNASSTGFEMGDPGHLILFSHASPKARSYFVFG